ncbi:hypothetical protein J7L27_02955 [Candidatus Bathyarchaeota archaeon]|nr:hypothetical protein [Candidatus Bathyarchaeota archaeon]
MRLPEITPTIAPTPSLLLRVPRSFTFIQATTLSTSSLASFSSRSL